MSDDRRPLPPGVEPAPASPGGAKIPAASETDGVTRSLNRIPLVLTVKKEYEYFSDFIVEFGAHIYPEGMFVPTPRPKAKGTQIKVEFRTRDGFQILMALCEVVRCDEALPGALSGMWVSFKVMDDEHRALVQKIFSEREHTGSDKPDGVMGAGSKPDREE